MRSIVSALAGAVAAPIAGTALLRATNAPLWSVVVAVIFVAVIVIPRTRSRAVSVGIISGTAVWAIVLYLIAAGMGESMSFLD